MNPTDSLDLIFIDTWVTDFMRLMTAIMVSDNRDFEWLKLKTLNNSLVSLIHLPVKII